MQTYKDSIFCTIFHAVTVHDNIQNSIWQESYAQLLIWILFRQGIYAGPGAGDGIIDPRTEVLVALAPEPEGGAAFEHITPR